MGWFVWCLRPARTTLPIQLPHSEQGSVFVFSPVLRSEQKIPHDQSVGGRSLTDRHLQSQQLIASGIGIHEPLRLGACVTDDPRQTPVLARHVASAAYPPGGEATGHPEADRLAHLPTYAASLLMSSGSSVMTTKELMRHATADITLELYAQAVTEDKRQAQNALAALIAGPTIPAISAGDTGFRRN